MNVKTDEIVNKKIVQIVNELTQANYRYHSIQTGIREKRDVNSHDFAGI